MPNIIEINHFMLEMALGVVVVNLKTLRIGGVTIGDGN